MRPWHPRGMTIARTEFPGSVKSIDLLVIGGGAAGLTAAREGARRGAHTVLVSEGPLGGECTYTGCIPSKTLLAAAVRGDSFTYAMTAVRDAVERIAARESAPVLRSEGVEVMAGRATLHGRGRVDVDGTRLQARRIILATGTQPIVPDVTGLRGVGPLTNESVFSLSSRPGRLGVVGGGAVGAELAQAFARLGSTVCVIEAETRLLPREEPEASELVRTVFTRHGIDLRLGQQLEQVRLNGSGTVLRLDDGAELEVDEVLVAAGRRAATEGLGLDEAGVELDDRGFVRTDDTMATSADGVWAVGDVNGRMLFTHAAARMAIVATHNTLSRWSRVRPSRFDPAPIPWVTFTEPEIARVGMTEAEAADHGGRVAHLPLDAVDRAVATGSTDGFVKLIAGPRRGLGNIGGGRILGATVVAPTGGELIGEIALAMRTGMFTGRLAQTTHAYPTWSTAIQEATAQFFMTYDGRAARPARSGTPGP